MSISFGQISDFVNHFQPQTITNVAIRWGLSGSAYTRSTLGGGMAKIWVDIDEEALAEAAQALGTTTPSDTVNGALADAVARAAEQNRVSEADTFPAL